MRQITIYRPLVGIVPSRDGEKAMMAQRYMDAVWYAGGLPVVLGYTTDPNKLEEYATIFDGFLFSGGVDVDPAYYGEEKQFDSVEIDEQRDAFEKGLFKAVYPTKKPILGICLGMQLLFDKSYLPRDPVHQRLAGRYIAPAFGRTSSKCRCRRANP